MSRYEKKYGKLIGKKGDKYIFLDYVFKDGTFQGATGTVMRPITKDEYDERTDPGNIQDNYENIWRETVHAGRTTEGLEDWIDTCIRIDGVDDVAFDTSYWRGPMWDQLRELGYTEEEYPVFECTGGGRCFTSTIEWDEIYDHKLWKLIQKYESPNEKKRKVRK